MVWIKKKTFVINHPLLVHPHKVYERLYHVWVVCAGILIKSQNAVVNDLERKFQSQGLPHALTRETLTGKTKPEAESEPTDRAVRLGTQEASAASKMGPGPRKRAGKKRKYETKKAKAAKSCCTDLYDIALPDSQQSPKALEFLTEQRTSRLSRLPPVLGELGVERRSRQRAEKEEERRNREEAEASMRFATEGIRRSPLVE